MPTQAEGWVQELVPELALAVERSTSGAGAGYSVEAGTRCAVDSSSLSGFGAKRTLAQTVVRELVVNWLRFWD